ncbi:MAG: hypothetical protein M1833_002755 [Piccolia ochrophora]|nr:MAG: hypothetical protein M1833_002755 [Piccolia ochrophora]
MKSKKPTPPPQAPPPAPPRPILRNVTPPPDPTPMVKAELEGLLNFHLSQLGTMTHRLEWLNEQIDRDGIVLTRLQSEEGKKKEAKYMNDRIHVLWVAKKGLGKNVTWHREEIKRLTALLSQGRSPEMATKLPQEIEWADMAKD